MADQLGYGQPMGGIAQTAFVVEDLHDRDRPLGHQLQAPGRSSCSDTSWCPDRPIAARNRPPTSPSAMGFAGHMLIELIQPLDNNPSVYQETHRARAATASTISASPAPTSMPPARDYQQRGYDEAFRAAVPTGGEVVYLDNGSGAAMGLPRTAAGDAGHGRDLHPLLESLPRLGRLRSRPLVPLRQGCLLHE